MDSVVGKWVTHLRRSPTTHEVRRGARLKRCARHLRFATHVVTILLR
jgi:hypothetical protein